MAMQRISLYDAALQVIMYLIAPLGAFVGMSYIFMLRATEAAEWAS